jgi:hypothetical protein
MENLVTCRSTSLFKPALPRSIQKNVFAESTPGWYRLAEEAHEFSATSGEIR